MLRTGSKTPQRSGPAALHTGEVRKDAWLVMNRYNRQFGNFLDSLQHHSMSDSDTEAAEILALELAIREKMRTCFARIREHPNDEAHNDEATILFIRVAQSAADYGHRQLLHLQAAQTEFRTFAPELNRLCKVCGVGIVTEEPGLLNSKYQQQAHSMLQLTPSSEVIAEIMRDMAYEMEQLSSLLWQEEHSFLRPQEIGQFHRNMDLLAAATYLTGVAYSIMEDIPCTAYGMAVEFTKTVREVIEFVLTMQESDAEQLSRGYGIAAQGLAKVTGACVITKMVEAVEFMGDRSAQLYNRTRVDACRVMVYELEQTTAEQLQTEVKNLLQFINDTFKEPLDRAALLHELSIVLAKRCDLSDGQKAAISNIPSTN